MLRPVALVVILVAFVLVVSWLLAGSLGEARRRDRLDVARERAVDDAQRSTEAALARPGATPDHPLEVASAAAIEPRAQREPCPLCSGPLHVQAHEVGPGGEGRHVRLRCGRCGRETSLFFRLRPESLPS
jgi:hypothetical protein